MTNEVLSVLNELNELSTVLQTVGNTSNIPGAAPQSIDEMNDYLNTFGHSEISSLHSDLPVLSADLAARYKIDQELRSTVDFLPELEIRRGINPEIQKRMQKNIESVTSNFSEVATNTYETENGIHTDRLLSTLNSLAGDSAFKSQTIKFSSPSDIANFLSEVRASQQYLQEYNFLPSFGSWSAQEQEYYDQIGKILVTVQPLVVYVPTQ